MTTKEKRLLQLKHNLYQLALLSFVVVVIWIGFEIYWAYSSPEKIEKINTDIKPLNPNVYSSLANELIKRSELPLKDLERYRSQVATFQTKPSPAPTTTGSGFFPTETPSSTNSGTPQPNLQ